MNELNDIFFHLINKESYKDIETLTSNTEDFDEVPLVSRLENANVILKPLGGKRASEVLLGLAVFVSTMARTHGEKDKNYFNCLTFNDFDVHCETGLIIPYIFYTKKKLVRQGLDDLRKRSKPSRELSAIVNLFERVGIDNSFSIFEERFIDNFHDEIVRVYALIKS